MQSGRRPGRAPSMGLVSRAAGGRGAKSLPRCGRRNPRPHPLFCGREMQPFFCVLCGGPRPRLRHPPPVPRCKELQALKRPQYARGRLAGLRTRTGRIAASGAAVAAVEGEIVALFASKKPVPLWERWGCEKVSGRPVRPRGDPESVLYESGDTGVTGSRGRRPGEPRGESRACGAKIDRLSPSVWAGGSLISPTPAGVTALVRTCAYGQQRRSGSFRPWGGVAGRNVYAPAPGPFPGDKGRHNGRRGC